MQTFLPFSSFERSANCLDYRRLGKQRVEAKQIYLALTEADYGWKNHPAVKMWKGYETALARYGLVICQEWKRRGYRDTLESWFFHKAYNHSLMRTPLPDWIDDEAFHASHRSNLLRKDPVWYGQFGWTEAADLPYVWPVPTQ